MCVCVCVCGACDEDEGSDVIPTYIAAAAAMQPTD